MLSFALLITTTKGNNNYFYLFTDKLLFVLITYFFCSKTMKTLSSQVTLLSLLLIGFSKLLVKSTSDLPCLKDDDDASCSRLTGSVCSSDGLCRCKVGQVLASEHQKCIPQQCQAHADCNPPHEEGFFFTLLVGQPNNVLSCNSLTRLCECDEDQSSKVGWSFWFAYCCWWFCLFLIFVS